MDRQERTPDELRRYQVADTIFEQLGGTSRLNLMIGAKFFTALTTGDTPHGGASFRFPRIKSELLGWVNYFRVVRTFRGEYAIRFTYVHGSGCDVKLKKAGVHAEDLIRIFEGYTGLTLTMPKIYRVERGR